MIEAEAASAGKREEELIKESPPRENEKTNATTSSSPISHLPTDHHLSAVGGPAAVGGHQGGVALALRGGERRPDRSRLERTHAACLLPRGTASLPLVGLVLLSVLLFFTVLFSSSHYVVVCLSCFYRTCVRSELSFYHCFPLPHLPRPSAHQIVRLLCGGGRSDEGVAAKVPGSEHHRRDSAAKGGVPVLLLPSLFLLLFSLLPLLLLLFISVLAVFLLFRLVLSSNTQHTRRDT